MALQRGELDSLSDGQVSGCGALVVNFGQLIAASPPWTNDQYSKQVRNGAPSTAGSPLVLAAICAPLLNP